MDIKKIKKVAKIFEYLGASYEDSLILAIAFMEV